MAGIDGALRDLVGGVPTGAIGQGGDRPVANTKAGERGGFLQVLVAHPRTVSRGEVEGDQAVADVCAGDDATVVVLTAGHLDETARQGLESAEAGRPGGGEVPRLGEVGPLPV